jgi:hypothetical protein
MENSIQDIRQTVMGASLDRTRLDRTSLDRTRLEDRRPPAVM